MAADARDLRWNTYLASVAFRNRAASFVHCSLPYAAAKKSDLRHGCHNSAHHFVPLALIDSLERQSRPTQWPTMPLIRIRSKTASTAASPLPDLASMIQAIDSSELSKTARRFSRSTGLPIRGSTRSQKYRKEMIIGDCPKRQNYYVCQSTGFRGCCSQNACDPKVTCPEGGQSESESSSGAPSSASTEGSNEQSGTASPTNDASSETSSAIAQSTSEGQMSAASDSTTTEGSTKSETRTVKSIVTSASGAPSDVPANGTAIRATEDVALAPSCPRGNGTTYVDINNIAYVVRCNSDNSAPSYNSVQVSIGGYGQCFSSCSDSSDCAGFTYVGLDDGVCYLKATMPKDTYVAKGGSNYISTAKIDPSASAPRPTPTSEPTSSMQPNKGAIAGGVVGGIAVIGLVLFLIAFIVKRRKKEIENKRATLTHIFGGAVEPGHNNDDTHTLPLHNRNGSTSHDVFAPYGGAYSPQYFIAPSQPSQQPQMQQHARQRSVYRPPGEASWL